MQIVQNKISRKMPVKLKLTLFIGRFNNCKEIDCYQVGIQILYLHWIITYRRVRKDTIKRTERKLSTKWPYESVSES